MFLYLFAAGVNLFPKLSYLFCGTQCELVLHILDFHQVLLNCYYV